MIFTQEAPLTRKWFSGRSCVRPNWNNLGVNFEEEGNRSARRKPSSWDRLKLNPHTNIWRRGGRRDWCPVRQTNSPRSTDQGILSRWSPIHPDINPVQQGLTSVNRRCFGVGDVRALFDPPCSLQISQISTSCIQFNFTVSRRDRQISP